MRDACKDGTLLELNLSGNTLIYMLYNNIALNTYPTPYIQTHTEYKQKWGNLNRIGGLNQCQYPGYVIVLLI